MVFVPRSYFLATKVVEDSDLENHFDFLKLSKNSSRIKKETK